MYLFQNNPIRGKQRRRSLLGSCCKSSLNLVAANKCCSEWGRVMKYLRHWAASHLRALILVCFSTTLRGPPPTPYSYPDKLCRCQEDSGPLGDPVDICCLLHMWLDLTQAHRWEREIPGGSTHSSAARPTWREGFGNSWLNLWSRFSTWIVFWFSDQLVRSFISIPISYRTTTVLATIPRFQRYQDNMNLMNDMWWCVFAGYGLPPMILTLLLIVGSL